jgi:oligopeptide/dipeptide ABC transporter ATP-binding protein
VVGLETALLEVNDLRTHFHSDDGVVKAVDGVSFTLNKGKILGIVGESGCGKSITSLSIMRLLAAGPGCAVTGQILFDGVDLLGLTEAEMHRIRGNRISMIFQEPMTSLNPLFTVGDQIMESVLLHQKAGKREARDRAIDMLRLVGIPSPEKRVDVYPHQLSGGMRQRVMIAIALACNPKLLIADEPTTALDVTIQAQILDLMAQLREDLGTSIILITHDLGVVAEMADEVVVMYCGKVVEQADVGTLFENPRHPYTQGLLRSIPQLDRAVARLPIVRGVVPSPSQMPAGCAFHPRCDCAEERCGREAPLMTAGSDAHWVRCFRAEAGAPSFDGSEERAL